MKDRIAQAAWSGWTVVVIGIIALSLLIFGMRAIVDVLATRASSHSAWHVHLTSAEAELGAGNVTAALHHGRDAYAAARASRRSDGLVEVGDFHRRLAARPGLGASAIARARECYLNALLRARVERSLDGILRATEGFFELGDRDMVEQGLAMARDIARRDPDPKAPGRVHMLSVRAHRAGGEPGR